MIKRIWSNLTGGTLVWRKDYDGEITLSFAHTDPWGEMSAKRWWPFDRTTVRLLPDGTVTTLTGDQTYVSKWKYYSLG